MFYNCSIKFLTQQAKTQINTHTDITEMRTQGNQHFSHPHTLMALQLEQGKIINCNACEQQIHDQMFQGCTPCNYWLHQECLDTPRFLQHPSHPSHPLTLLPCPTYSSRGYSCNACGSMGNAFSFSCALCEFDLHLQCASFPATLHVPKHHPHPLKLLFEFPFNDKNVTMACDVCRGKMEPHHWFYYCAPCDFGTHLGCADGKIAAQSKARRNEENFHIPAVQMINSINEAQEQLAAAQLKALIDAKGRQNILDSVTPSRKRYEYDYI